MALTNKLEDIGDAIRRKNGETAKYTLPQMVTKIDAIDDGLALVQNTLTKSKALTFGDSAFSMMNARITSLTLPNATTFGANFLKGNTAITDVSLPAATTFGASAFYSCTNLTNVSLPAATTFTGSCNFFNCKILTKLSLPKLESLNAYAFCRNNAALTTLVLSNTAQVATVTNATYMLGGTPIEKKTGYIYVPDALVDSYKTATGWKTFAAQIKPLSELPTT